MTIADDPVHPSHPAAARWLEEHGDALYAYAKARVRDQSVAEDLVQEALLAAIVSADQFLGQAAERTWLIGILKHKLLDHLRRQLRERPASDFPGDNMADLFDRHGHWKVAPSKWSADPHHLAENAEFRSVLAKCLSRLPSRMAQLFCLREEEGVDTSELCKRLAISTANVWAILSRARLSLRRCLNVHWFEGDQTR